jgi:hypothetical protein
LTRLLENGMASLLSLLVDGSRWDEVVEPIQRHSESYMSRTCKFRQAQDPVSASHRVDYRLKRRYNLGVAWTGRGVTRGLSCSSMEARLSRKDA